MCKMAKKYCWKFQPPSSVHKRYKRQDGFATAKTRMQNSHIQVKTLVKTATSDINKWGQTKHRRLQTENITSSSVRGTMPPSVKSRVMCEVSNIRAMRVIQTSKKPDLISISWSSWHNSCWNSVAQSAHRTINPLKCSGIRFRWLHL